MMWPVNLLKRFTDLSRRGVLGMNRRNMDYVGRYNDRRLYPLVDNKLRTKRLSLRHGVNTPALLAVVDNQRDVTTLGGKLASFSSFCLKPAKGSGGKGILVVKRSADGLLRHSDGEPASLAEIQRHTSNIIAGLFSLGGGPDEAIFESLIEVDPRLAPFSYKGVPDLRIIVFRGYPVMAMMRLSCTASRGKANLHQGAVGVGIDIASGRAVRAVQRDRPVTHHPDTGQDLLALTIPAWQDVLQLACTCHDMTGLGYLGVDLILDRDRGPMLLELNARPGLSIQVANGCGLLPRLQMVESVKNAWAASVAERIEFSQQHFADEALGTAPRDCDIPVQAQ